MRITGISRIMISSGNNLTGRRRRLQRASGSSGRSGGSSKSSGSAGGKTMMASEASAIMSRVFSNLGSNLERNKAIRLQMQL